MVLIFAPVKIEITNKIKIGIRLIEIKKKIFLFLIFIFVLIFFKRRKIKKKNGIKIINCFIIKIIGFLI